MYEEYYENDNAVLKNMIFSNSLYEKGFLSWKIKEKRIEIIPCHFYTQKTFIIYYLVNGQRKRVQQTMLEIETKPKDSEFFSIEKCIENNLAKSNVWTEYGKEKYKQVLKHFQKYTSIEELQNNLFIFQKTFEKHLTK
jgi:hypothetical protein